MIEEARVKRKMTQKDLAEKVGTTQQNIARYESGIVRPPYPIALKIIKELKLSHRKFMEKFGENEE